MIKKAFLPTAIALAGVAALPSCSKKSSSSKPQQSCELVTVNIQSQTGTPTINLTYNEQGQRTGVQIVNPGQPTIDRQYSFSGNTVYVAQTIGGSPAVNDTATLNSNGQLATEYGVNLQIGARFLITYTYSGDQLVKFVAQDSVGNVTASSFFTWSGGNMVREVDVVSNGNDTVNFTYNNKPAQGGDYWDLFNLENYPVKLYKTANMVSGVAFSGISVNYSYATDSTGKLSGLTFTYGQTTVSYVYQWSCQ